MKHLLFWLLASLYTFASFGQVCVGVVTLMDPIEVDKENERLHAKFLMHSKTFVCDPKESDSVIPKLKGVWEHEVFVFGDLDMGEPKAGEKMRVRYRLAEGVTIGGGGYLNWEVIDPPYALRLSSKEKENLSSHTIGLKTLQKTKHYKGNLFEVDYPVDFTPSITMKHQGKWYYAPTDEATFLSPDKRVAFFIFSPHWGGEPKSYHKVAKNERLVFKEVKNYHPSKRKSSTTTYVTLKDKKGRYSRSYAYTVSCYVYDNGSKDSCEATTFGFKYRDKKSYEYYKVSYLNFKKSLMKSMPE